jgi:hypothetical protein
MTAITRYRGDTDPISGVVSLNDLPLNVTGCSFVLTVDPSKTPADATNNLFALTGTLVTPLTGEITFPITAEQADQTPATYYFDIQLVDALGYKRTIALDKFVFKQDITKA